MITFEYKKTQRKPVFSNVAENQFFIDCDGYLCQKVDDGCYSTIAKGNGKPYSCHCPADPEDVIDRILADVSKINFPTE